jgi:cytochrome c55X
MEALGRLGMTAVLVAVTLAWQVASAQTPLDGQRVRELTRLVRQDCGSCHGMTLKGGLGPPLLPQNLRDKPIESLKSTVLGGRPGTPMPPWRTILSEAEVDWIVEQLVRGFPQDE